jgi:DNA-binding cell septation regulator SpoVG
MHISVTWHDKNFNLDLASSEGKEAFLSIKGCRLVEGGKGEFISFPSRKNEQTGKYWNHVWANAAFQEKVIGIARASRPSVIEQTSENDIPF